MNFGVLVETISLDDGNVIKKYENLRFIDSFKMMNSLVDILPRDCFGILASVFPNLSSTELKLLQQKGYYPYSYVSSRKKFSEKSLPPLNERQNTLEVNSVKITQENLNQAKTMWNTLNCQTLQENHDAYLETDCALLACVCKFHRELSFPTYKLDCMHFYTLPNMAKEASLRICKAEVELHTERDHLNMVKEQYVGEYVQSTRWESLQQIINICQIMTLHNPGHLASAWTPTIYTVASCRLKNSLSQTLRNILILHWLIY